VRALAAGTALHPSEFINLFEHDEAKRGFRLWPNGPFKQLHLIRRADTRACTFLMEIALDKPRCGVYAHRPLVCRNFPAALKRGTVAVRSGVTCGPNSWNLAAMDLPTYRRDLLRANAAWNEHWKIVAAWNTAIDATNIEKTPDELFAFLLSYTPEPS